jgi:hypothetical protein
MKNLTKVHVIDINVHKMCLKEPFPKEFEDFLRIFIKTLKLARFLLSLSLSLSLSHNVFLFSSYKPVFTSESVFSNNSIFTGKLPYEKSYGLKKNINSFLLFAGS